MLLEVWSTKHTRAEVAKAIGTPCFLGYRADPPPKERARCGVEGKASGKTDRRAARSALSPEMRLAARKRDKAARALATSAAAAERRSRNIAKYGPNKKPKKSAQPKQGKPSKKDKRAA